MARRNEELGIVLGMLLTLVLHAVFLTLFVFLSNFIPYLNRNYNFFLVPATIGLWQIIYIIPLVIILKRQERFGVARGLIIMAVLTAFLNGGCWVLLTLPR